jgi:4-amino-4-deoxy-L-arabinose transferase-like glycosyltransferase
VGNPRSERPTAGQLGFGWLSLVSLLLLTGFWLRLSFLLGSVYDIDEFFSMLAAKMVAERGLPILPSGLFYDHGLLLSFLSGAFIALAGFREEIARWPTLLISVFTIAAYYVTAGRLFHSRLAGLLAAALATFDAFSIERGVQARMYAQAHLFVLLSLVLLLQGTLKHPSQRSRYLFLAFLAAALFSHTITILLLPPIGLLLLLFSLAYRPAWLRHPRLWQEAMVGLGLLALVLVIVSLGHPGGMSPPTDPNANAPSPLGLDLLQGLFSPSLEWSRFDNLVGFFEHPGYRWLLPFIALALLEILFGWLRRVSNSPAPVLGQMKLKTPNSESRGSADVMFLYLALLIVLVVFEMGAFLTETRTLARYLFILALPAFFLLSSASVARLLQWLAYLVSRLAFETRVRPAALRESLVSPRRGPTRTCGGAGVGKPHLTAATSLAGLALIVAQFGPAAWDIAHSQATGDYHTAFAFVRQNWQADDRVMTFHPAAAYLYLRRCDYYANQVTAKVLPDDEEGISMIDRYTGSPLIDSVEELNALLAGGHRIWFVVDRHRLFNRYEPFFSQQIFAQMDAVYQAGEVYVFASRPHPVPVQAEPAVMLAERGNFDNFIHLEGYSLDQAAIAPDGSASLGLYWHPIGDARQVMKVFVQLRDGQGETIAQADHFIFEGLLGAGEWNKLRETGEWLRDTADLRLPLPLPLEGGPYRVYVGLYDPDTQERASVVNDTSGENAVVINLP